MKYTYGFMTEDQKSLVDLVDSILTEKKPVDIPWEKFTFEK